MTLFPSSLTPRNKSILKRAGKINFRTAKIDFSRAFEK